MMNIQNVKLLNADVIQIRFCQKDIDFTIESRTKMIHYLHERQRSLAKPEIALENCLGRNWFLKKDQ